MRTWLLSWNRAIQVQIQLCLMHFVERFSMAPVCDDEAHACAGAGINDCEKKGSPCGPTHGQLQDGQSYLCVSFNASNLDKVADVLRGDELTIYATNIDGLADQYPNMQKLIKANRRGG